MTDEPSAPPQPFIHLRVHSAFSLAEGAIKLKDLIKLCQKNDMPAVAVTDTNNLFGALQFAYAAADAGIQPIIGCQLNIARPDETRGATPKPPDQIVLLAQDKKGYANLMKLSSAIYLDGSEGLYSELPLERLEGYTDGLIALTGGPQGSVGRMIADGQPDAAETFLQRLMGLFPDRLYVEIQRHGLPVEAKTEPALLDLAYKHNLPLVATNDCFFPDEGMYEAHDALLCIAEGVTLDATKRRKVTPDHRFKSSAEMRLMFADLPEAIDNTVVIAKRCAFKPKGANPILPPFPTEGGRSEEEELKAQAREGLEHRIQQYNITDNLDVYWHRLDYELGIIIKMGFPGYFLIVSDFIKWAKANDIPVGPGRGSGAGSLVAWSLSITDMDPIPFNLLFERFLNPERVSMPDFDVDFCQDRRDEVISYVQRRYGREKVSQIITFGKLQARAVLRDVGRVMGLSWGQVDKLCKLVPNDPAHPVTLEEAIKNEPALRAQIATEESNQRLVEVAQKLEGLYRHAGTHAGGVVIVDRPLDELSPMYRDPRSDMPVTQFNFKDAEKIGLVKFDFLGLKTLSVIKKAVALIERSDSFKLDISSIPLNDRKSYDLLARAETVGVFQVESGGMRDTLRKLRPDKLEELTALLALYRPGPMGFIPTYIAVKNGLEKPDYMHPLLEPVLKETYGIMIYQEQVMELAKVLAGYTLGGADLLRRAMGKKIKAEMDAQRDIFIKGAQEHHQVDAHLAGDIFDKVAKFADYGFNKSHSAVYALVSYQTAYLKANHPHEFMAASMTYEMGNTDKLGQFRQELDRMGIPLLTPDVNASLGDFSVEKLKDGKKAVRYALAAIKGVGLHAMQGLVEERTQNGPFKSLPDFFRRVDFRNANRKTLENLIRAGAFDSLEPNRAYLMQHLDTLMAYGQQVQAEKASGQSSLFGSGDQSPPPALSKVSPWDAMQKLQQEFAVIGFFLSAHPLDQHLAVLKRLGVVQSSDLMRLASAGSMTRYRVAGVVLAKSEKVSKSGNRFAFVTLSDSTGVFEMMVFSELLAVHRETIEVGKRVTVTVDVQVQDEGMRLTCAGIEPLDTVLDRVSGSVSIILDSAESLDKLAEVLSSSQGGKRQVGFRIKLDDGREADLSLPGSFDLSQEKLTVIQRLAGVHEVVSL